MPASADLDPPPLFVPIGDNDARPFGMDAIARAGALAAKAGLEPAGAPGAGRAVVLADMDYVWDPAWAKTMAARPGTVLVKDGRPVLAHITADGDADAAIAAMRGGNPIEGLEPIDADSAELSYHELRKRERPFVMRLDSANVDAVERAAYDASYKGVTDALTLYLWRRPAFYLTRCAARAGASPNQVTSVGAILCAATFFLWVDGHYWPGILTGFGFMVLDTVDGKLARCTGQSSKWGNIFDHGIDLIHPPFWWWAWAEGLKAVGQPLEPVYQLMVVGAIVGGYVLQRLIEGLFIHFYRMDIHVWRPVDSGFRLVTARRNPNMAILTVALLFGRPDLGIQLVALWTVASLLFHAARLAQANDRARRGRKIISWLA
ncbi:MAG: CDP-alcohol phosphatidyltransferase family protein [Sphingomicrobium sp.]